MTDLPRPDARGVRGAVACGHPLATSAGLKVLQSGGNALDAALAAAWALCVLQPEACGLGGDALFTVRLPTGATTSLNGSGLSPRALNGPVPEDGAGTTAVPGLVAALADAHEQFGQADWRGLLAPAIRLARDGFPAGENLIDVIGRQRARLARSGPGWDLLNSTLVPGSIVRQEGLAATLEEIAQHGGRIFYEGDIADAIVRAAGADGSALSREDLATHATVQRDPLQIGFGDATVFCQPPVSQAAVALMALKRLDALGDLDPGSRSHVAIEAIDAAFLHRDELVDVGAAVRLLATELDIDLGRASRRAGARSTAHTTAVATADGDGLVVSMLISIFDEFGCATLVPEGGFFLNDRMLGFARDPASPNAPAQGKRPIHTLSPLLVVQRERVFAAATPGADGQVQTLTQLIDGILTEGLSITAALDRRRWRASDGQLLLEEGFRTEIAELLAERGHLLEWRPAGDRSFGAAVLAGTDLVSNSAFAAADLRREAWAGAC